MAPKLTTIGLDADDTLWQNEQFFRLTQERFADLMSDYVPSSQLAERLLAAEKKNLGRYGFGIKGFVLSMIEVAVEVSDGAVSGHVIQDILSAGQDMLQHPVELLPDVRETIETLADDFRLVLITKGDLMDQERKLAQSGLGDLFHGVEIVTQKSPDTYRDIFARYSDGNDKSMMVGNSMRSDILPALQAGGWAVFIPHDLTWEVEHGAAPIDHDRYFEVPLFSALTDLVQNF